MTDWDAARYHRISDPQLAWGRGVAERLLALPGECILDIGCGTGRLTGEIAAQPGISVVGLDPSAAMLREAVRHNRGLDGRPRPRFVRGDGAALPFTDAFDAVFSAATFHWIPDHDRLFTSVFRALKKSGRLLAQAGGAGNLDRLYERAHVLMASPAYSRYFSGWTEPFHFEDVAGTEARLERAGFVEIDVSLVSAPVPFEQPDRYAEFVAAVCLRHHLHRLPEPERDGFMWHITTQAQHDDSPLTLDYWRLNIAARKARG
jgi:trans-aconitate 2-methyltransferase